MEDKSPKADPADRGDLVRLPKRMTNKLRVIAACRRASMGELLEQYAAERIDADHAAAIEEQKVLAHDVGGEG